MKGRKYFRSELSYEGYNYRICTCGPISATIISERLMLTVITRLPSAFSITYLTLSGIKILMQIWHYNLSGARSFPFPVHCF